MAKKSQRRPLRNEKDQAGCIWGLINIFDFRHGRSTRKLLADRRRWNRQAVGAESPRTKLTLTDPDVKYQDMEDGEESQIFLADTAKTSVKKLMEEEMFKDEDHNNQIDDSEVGSKLFDAEFGGHTRKHHKRRNKISKKSNVLDLSDLDAAEDLKHRKSCEQVKPHSVLDKSDLEIIVQELCQIHQTSCGCVEHLQNDNSSDVQLDQAGPVDKEMLAAAINMFVDQSLCNNMHSREDGRVQQTREFMDALHKVSSNKHLLLKFLQDPNSLLVKQSIGLEESQLEKHPEINPLPRYDFLEEKIARSKTDDLINQKPRKFFRRRSKSQEHFPSTESEKSQSSSKIVILRPGSATSRQPETQINVGSSLPSHYPIDNKINGERSQFSFTEIKRKLKHAIRKDRQDTSTDGIIPKSRPENPRRRDIEKGVGGENAGWCSPNRNHFYMERFAKPSVSFRRGETIDKSSPTEATTGNDHLQPRVSNIYVEAKKHLLEMLSTGNDDTELTRQKLPKSLGRILSFSEYNYSPIFSPRKDREESFPSTPLKLSPRTPVHSAREGTHQVVEEDRDTHLSPTKSSSENQSCLPCENHKEKIEPPNESANVPHDHDQANIVEKTVSSVSDMIISKGSVEIEDATNTSSCQEANEFPLSSSEPSISPIKGDAAEECNEDRLIQSPKMESVGKSQIETSPVTSSSHSVTKKDEVSERPSPISVLDPLFSEDDISPARTISKPVELEIQPRQINFEEQMSCSDQGTCMQTSLQDEESAFEYVEAVLLGSGLNWDEYLLRWLSSCPILDSVLYDEVELFSSRSRAEQKLLFDCTNEVLEEVCNSYFGSLSGGERQSMRTIPKAMDLILEIWRGVEWHILQHPPPPQSLDQLVRNDMAKSKSRAWMDLRADTQNIGEEMEKAILETLVEDIISSFINDTSHSNYVVLQADSRS